MPNSAFQMLYQSCIMCIASNSANLQLVLRTFIEPKFAQFINYCAEFGGGAFSTVAVVTNSASIDAQ
jgi:hypothetical protein